MKVSFSLRATEDIIQIADYLTERNPQVALAVDAAIRNALTLVSEFPASGRALTQRSRVRVMPLARYRYLIFYTIAADEVLVLHIRHGVRAPLAPEAF